MKCDCLFGGRCINCRKPFDPLRECTASFFIQIDARERAKWSSITSKIIPPPPVPPGVGDEFEGIAKSIGLNEKAGCRCDALRALMNKLGPDGCRERRDELISSLGESAKGLSWKETATAAVGLLFSGVAWSLGGMLDEAIRRCETSPRFIDCSEMHLGDLIIFAWIAEGTKGEGHELKLCATGKNASLLTKFGIQVSEPVAGRSSNPPFLAEQANCGTSTRMDFYCDWYGVARKYKRPVITIPAEAKEFAESFGVTKNTVLLFPDCTMKNRQWPVRYWNKLAEDLQSAGKNVLCMPVANPSQYKNAVRVFPFENVVACIERAGMVIGVDSGPVNWATLFDVPTLAIMGPTPATIFSHASNVSCISASKSLMPCVGCFFQAPFRRDFCYNVCLAMANVSPEEVLAAALQSNGLQRAV